MKRKLLLGLLIIQGLIMIQAQELSRKGDHWRFNEQKTIEVKLGGTLKLVDISGDVDIKTWDQPKVQIDAVHEIDVYTQDEAEAIKQKLQDSVSKESNTVILQGTDFNKKSVSSEYRIIVPKTFNCDAEVKGGDFSIEGMNGQLKVDLGGGDMSISEVLGPVSVQQGGGDLSIEGCKKELSVKLGGGDLSVEDAGGSVQLDVGGGDVELTDCEGPVKLNLGGGDLEISGVVHGVEAQVGGGDMELQDIKGGVTCNIGGGSLEMDDISGSVSAKSGAGDIELGLSELPADAAVHIETGIGDIAISLPAGIKASLQVEVKKMSEFSDEEIESDFPLQLNTEKDGGANYLRAKAELNGGGPVIYLKSHGGDISIEKED
jgi:DUF4097 and DUF4098 domain-containing protein YvlB